MRSRPARPAWPRRGRGRDGLGTDEATGRFHSRTRRFIVVLTKTAFDLLGEPVTWAELFGFITGIACVALAAAGRIENFPVGIANNLFFLVLFANARLFADASLQIVYIVLGMLGWLT